MGTAVPAQLEFSTRYPVLRPARDLPEPPEIWIWDEFAKDTAGEEILVTAASDEGEQAVVGFMSLWRLDAFVHLFHRRLTAGNHDQPCIDHRTHGRPTVLRRRLVVGCAGPKHA